MKNKLKLYSFLSLLLLGSFALVKCSDKDPVAVPLPTLAEKMATETDLTIFTAAVKQAKLETFTKGPGPFTVFAPTDAALTASGITLSTLPTIDSITLTAILLTHFQSGLRTNFEIPNGPNAAMTSISGAACYASKVGGNSYINGQALGTKDILCGNGTIHKINGVLFPPFLNVMGALTANSNYSLMVQAITKVAGTTTTAYGANPITVYAIPNSAMTAAGYTSSAIAGANAATITAMSNFLRYHVVSGRLFSPDMKAGTLRMVQGTNTVVALNPITIKGTNNPTPFAVTPSNLVFSNGIIQEVSGILLP